MDNIIKELYNTIKLREKENVDGSYTCYLLNEGIDKILKKCGEECSETIIAAKNGDNTQTAEEICDLIYHLLVLMVSLNMPLEQVEEILYLRAKKLGNLKNFKQVDKNS